MIAVTGHRTPQINFEYLARPYDETTDAVIWVKKALEIVISERINEDFIVGGAGGVDTWAAEEALRQGGRVHLYIPCTNFSLNWPQASRDRLHGIASKAATVRVVTPMPYQPWMMQRRNEAMVDDCDRLIAVYNGSPGGTRNCMEYAARKGKPIILVDPARRTIEDELYEEIRRNVDACGG